METKNTPTQSPKRPPRHAKGEDFWRRHVKQWLNSGLSQSQYCREQKLASGSFATWKIKFVGPDSDKPPVQKKPLLLPIRIERKTPPFIIEVVINQHVALRVSSDQDPKALKHWIEALS